MSEILEIRFALSVRQPWAWLIVNGFKDVENRLWQTFMRGPRFIHTGKVMKEEEYNDCYFFLEEHFPHIRLPRAQDLPLGGIVGIASITDCVTRSNSKWFVGDYGFLMEDQQPCEFIPCKGEKGFFRPCHEGGSYVTASDLKFLKKAA
ncbi:MAG TPA: ASCH domain-containing protein [Verrucomicrobiae bacterium]